ncbi:MAG: type III-A CRISPR-associated RAMP protein Csm3 [Campylobacterales bacterium]
MKLTEIREISGVIELKSGLRIGGGGTEIKIGGVDNPVIKNPLTNEPYIPGSSLKGKIRTLLEWQLGLIGDGGRPYSIIGSSGRIRDEKWGEELVKLFGNGSTIKDREIAQKIGPTRVSFVDSFLINRQELLHRSGLTEEKTEVTIDRLSGTVGGGGPRVMERVPAGAKFQFSITLLQFEEDPADRLEGLLALGLKLLEMTHLGGSGSRGYGKIEFQQIKGLNSRYLTEGGRLLGYSELKSIVGL